MSEPVNYATALAGVTLAPLPERFGIGGGGLVQRIKAEMAA
jgi:hypothetical protein